MKVFISYGSAADQVTALRLQALAAVNGLTVYVPPAHTRQSTSALLDPDTRQRLNDAEVVLGVIGAGLTDACRQELNIAIQLRKSTIVMSGQSFAQQLQQHFGANLVVMDPADPGKTEMAIVHQLATADLNKKKALLALGTLALGLLIFAAATSD